MTDEVGHTIFNAYHLNGEPTTLLVALVEDQILLMVATTASSTAQQARQSQISLRLTLTPPPLYMA